MKRYTVEWNFIKEPEMLVIHIFPIRTFIFKGEHIPEEIAPSLATICCLNTVLIHNRKLSVEVDSKESLPEEANNFARDLFEKTDGRLDIVFKNTAKTKTIPTGEKKILLFSGGKDSLWQKEQLEREKGTFETMYVSGTAVAGEYHVEQHGLKKHMLEEHKTVHVDYVDYSATSMAFKYRARWKSLMLITLARMFSRNIWTGITQDETTSEDMEFYSEQQTTLQILADMLDCSIWLAPKESYIYQQMADREYNSCYSPDIPCNPREDFKNSCWKCRTLHIYGKLYGNKKLNRHEQKYMESKDWMGDDPAEITGNATGHGEMLCISPGC